MMSSRAECSRRSFRNRDRASIRQDHLNRNNPEKAGGIECVHNVRAFGTARGRACDPCGNYPQLDEVQIDVPMHRDIPTFTCRGHLRVARHVASRLGRAAIGDVAEGSQHNRDRRHGRRRARTAARERLRAEFPRRSCRPGASQELQQNAGTSGRGVRSKTENLSRLLIEIENASITSGPPEKPSAIRRQFVSVLAAVTTFINVSTASTMPRSNIPRSHESGCGDQAMRRS